MLNIKLLMLVISACSLKAQITDVKMKTDTLISDHVLEEIIINRHKNECKVDKSSSSLCFESHPLKERIGTGFLLESRDARFYFQNELTFLRDKLHLTLVGCYTYAKESNICA